MTMKALPQPVGRQREVLYLASEGHAVVLGTAGSGKTTLAILRSVHLANPSTDHSGRTLLVTFNRCLVTYMKHLARAIPGPVFVENYHLFARGYLRSRHKLPPHSICTPDQRVSFIRQAVEDARSDDIQSPILKRHAAFLNDEFQWIQGHGISDEQGYVAATRVGRAAARVVRADLPGLFDLYTRYRKIREQAGKSYDWSDLASSVHNELEKDDEKRRYRHIVIDEGQDFSPEMLRSLAAAVPENGSLTFFGDIAQQIYGHRLSWRDAGLHPPEVWRFEQNYRNTRQIAQLALALAEMPNFPNDPDLVEPRAPTADGPLPALVRFSNEREEQEFVISQASKAADVGTVAILFRTREQEKRFAQHPTVRATRLHRDLRHWGVGAGLFYGTYHAAKGLEFNTVFLPFLSKDRWPNPPDIMCFGEREACARDSQLLYVGITRAKSNLALTYSGQPTLLLPPNQTLYQS